MCVQEGLTPLILAIQQGHKDVAGILLKFGANPNLVEPVSAFSSCVYVELLIFISCAQTSGWGPLSFTCKEGPMEMVRLLLTGGADVQLQDKVKYTALYEILLTSDFWSSCVHRRMGSLHTTSLNYMGKKKSVTFFKTTGT